MRTSLPLSHYCACCCPAFSALQCRVWVSSHGDLDSYEVFNGLDSGVQRRLVGMVRAAEAASWEDARSAIIVCHSEPGAWALPHPLYETRPCPPVPVEEAAYVVARAMFESDRLSNLHVERWVA